MAQINRKSILVTSGIRVWHSRRYRFDVAARPIAQAIFKE